MKSYIISHDLMNESGANGLPAECTFEPSNYIFVSYTCWHLDEDLITRHDQFCVASSCSILVALLFLTWTRNAYQGSKISLLEFDVSTVTAGDYTVEMKVPMGKYKDWRETVYKSTYYTLGISSAMAFKETVRRDVENIILKEIFR